MPDQIEIVLQTENTVTGSRVRRTPAQLTTSVARHDRVKITNGNTPNPANPAAGRITLVIDPRQTARTILAAGLPPALAAIAQLPAAAAVAAAIPPVRFPLDAGRSVEWRIGPVAAGSHSGFSLNTEPARIDNPDHVDYHWDC